MRMEENAAIGTVTGEQIALWKGKHRNVVAIEIEDAGEKHVGYFRRPDVDTISAVTKLSKTDEVRSATLMFSSCWLGGSPLIKEDAVMQLAAVGELKSLMSVESVKVKNL